MSKINFKVNLNPVEAMEIIKQHQASTLVHEEILDIGSGKVVATLIFEKYYMRTSNRAALIITLDNLEELTDLRVVSTGTSQGVFLNFDWGAGDNYVESVRKSLKDYIVIEGE